MTGSDTSRGPGGWRGAYEAQKARAEVLERQLDELEGRGRREEPGAGEASGFSVEELLACARRELRLRERVYPRLVIAERMSADRAKRETLLQKAIVARLEAEAAKGRLL